MANSNFVVHNGLTVGPTTIDAASGNITVPVGRQITIGNVLIRDPGNGQLYFRDITDSNDAILNGTLDAGSQTLGNIQIGTNHIESINANGPISIRPNGSGTLVFAANLISAGKGAAELTIATGMAMPAEYGVTYANANILLSPGRDGLYSGNVRVTQTTAATSVTTGAFQVMGGVGITGNLNVGTGALQGGTHVFQGNIIPFSSNTYTFGSITNWWSKSFSVAATAQYADLAENYVSDGVYEPGTVVDFGGANEVTVCDSDMSSRVAGVVSTNPAYLMNGKLESEHVVAVALTGRVPTKVRGPIRKGDLMVSAGEGHARAENLPQIGTVIGKALEDFNGDAGVIEVVVGKH
jgi:hypothetical protein